MTKPRSWYDMKAVGGKRRRGSIMIYDEIGAFGIMAKDFIRDLRALGEIDDITLRINSPGGDVFGGIAIYNVLTAHPARVDVTIDGIAASAASLVAMAGDRIVMPENAMMMVHNASGIVLGDATEMREMADIMEKIGAAMVATYRAKTKMSDEEIRKMMEDETWMSAAEAVEKGFADEVAPPMMLAAKFDLSRFAHPPKALSDPPAGEPGDTPAGVAAGATSEQESDMTTETTTPAPAQTPAIDPQAIVKTERDRVSAIMAVAAKHPGHGDLAAKAVSDGGSAGDLAIAILNAQAAKGEQHLDTMRRELPQAPANPPAAPAAAATIDATALAGLPVDERVKRQWETSAEFRAGFTSLPQAIAYTKAVEAGNVRVLRSKAAA